LTRAPEIPVEGISGRAVFLRSLGRDDLPMLCAWFANPAVFHHWGGKPLSDRDVEDRYFGGRDDDLASLIVEANGCAVGYIQAWSADERSGGIDIVLLPDARGRALGVDAVRTLADWLRCDRHWERITVDPLAANARAIRAFEKAGFVKESEIPDAPEGPSLLMVYRAGSA
jgi:aminoglycoside 6'-N-acetyltransferase